ncbi:MAG UNVERIFIED_CONTAM: hypothetical protein LVR18_37445 [Planctomycetaceae bacterium]|jgi:hypothetical protein
MKTTNSANPFDVIPSDIVTIQHNPRLVSWMLSVWLGTVGGGGVFGALVAFQSPAAIPLFLVIGCVWAAVGSIPSLLVAAALGFAFSLIHVKQQSAQSFWVRCAAFPQASSARCLSARWRLLRESLKPPVLSPVW